jgi:hypothetical protein
MLIHTRKSFEGITNAQNSDKQILKNYCYLWVNLSLNLNAARTANYARQTVFIVNS